MFMLCLAKLRHVLLRVTSAASLFFLSTLAFAEYGLNLPPPVTPIARDILNLHNAIKYIEGETVSVISQKGSSQSHHEFPRYWAKLKLERDEYSWYPSRLKLGCYGRLVEIGSGLGEQDRQVLAKKLKNLMASPTYG